MRQWQIIRLELPLELSFYRTGQIRNVHCVPDIISLQAFKGAGVKEAWGIGFSHWIPICTPLECVCVCVWRGVFKITFAGNTETFKELTSEPLPSHLSVLQHPS